ncbi:hypothetical protein JQ631_18400 [Bradyrhizobium manausense]|uniref:hypothetical protein n=1 Tax=Bradyrhizobium manausense TaxID=989370 RepID=UPI001BA6E022|nr:hypothetical protein [Bradyrhizobium manausense]MBR0791054.1 hypothetical protein [Bradyrhizobium manausense]
MVRIAVSLIALLSLLTSAVAQTPPAPTAAPAQAATPAKPAAKKAAKPKAKPITKLPVAAESGPCRLGVISVIGEHYSVQKFGLTIFENEASEIPIDWGLDDLVFARVRAATGNDPAVRRIAYPRGVFEPFYNPKTILIRDPGEPLPVIVRSFTANAHCERYLVATTFKAELPNSHMTLNGIGTYNQGIGGILRHSHLFANVAITMIDGRSYEEIKRPFVNFGANFAASMRLTEDPLTKLDNSLFPDPPAAASANTTLRERTRALVADRLDRGLPGYLKED